MRLFIAINFEDYDKDRLYENVERLKEMTKKASFTKKENLHLTLVFLGETTKISLVEEIIAQSVEELKMREFILQVEDFGTFHRREGDICWLGVKSYTYLSKLNEYLTFYLRKAGFKIEEQTFKPHLTLARRTIFKKEYSVDQVQKQMNTLEIPVNKISLMKSERIEGKLVYTEIFKYKLLK
ncbi:RNA 2',3'-cyclic phosphodiesterase [Anaeromicropila herbilytica]|nr:RNA 2',3'-cyclic phosphodiesterase [Anaeromicropila herbilytica]